MSQEGSKPPQKQKSEEERWAPVNTLKKVLPSNLVRPLLPYWHFSRAGISNLRYGFPGRGLKVIAVTGTNGKTTTVNYLASILMAAGYKVGVSTTAVFRIGKKQWDNELNMTVTNPFALHKLLRRMKQAKVDWVVLEVTSIALHQRRLMGVPIDTAVMTNLSQDHLDYHQSMKRYASAKAKLLKQAKHTVVLNKDDQWFEFFKKYTSNKRLLTYGAGADCDVGVQKASLRAHGSKVLVRLGTQKALWELKLAGKFNVYNAMAAATAAMAHDIGIEHVTKGLEALDNVPGRMESVEAGQSYSVIVDYAHTPDAMENVFETLRPLTRGRLIAVFGSAGDRDRRKRPLMGQIASELCDVAIVTDDEPHTENPAQIRRSILKGAHHSGSKAKVVEVADRKDAIKEAFKLAKRGDTVAILGMGHQKFRAMNEGKVEWDDRAVARDLLKK